uniref:HoxN/HupN/NixA family nickel/cobalt transporter n=1 Tax=Lentilactobacillus hilgardii TaxID=1588 RepID=UPI00403F73F1
MNKHLSINFLNSSRLSISKKEALFVEKVPTQQYSVIRDGIKYGSYIFLLFATGWLLVILYLGKYPSLLAMAFLSFTFGLQHAFDVDHITTIDNITRKLINDGKNTHGVGFFFSLGHSLVVMLMTLITIFFVHWSKEKLPHFQHIGNLVGPIFSGTVLIVLGLINLLILIQTCRQFNQIRQGHTDQPADQMTHWTLGIFHRALQLIQHSWQTLIVGFLFGLGFDTATQISVLATSAVATNNVVPWLAVISFPLLFTAGMCLMDTSDGLFMSTAYSWLFSSPFQKVYYNIVLTGLSVTTAFFVGIVEFVQVAGRQFHLHNQLVQWCTRLNFQHLGIILVILFIITWSLALVVWRRLNHQIK